MKSSIPHLKILNSKMSYHTLMRIVILLIIISCLAIVAFVNVPKKGENNLLKKGFTVIELFTSEGCSSCPAADALVAKIQEEQKNEPVYILAYHVDYWDKLGWKDIFSNKDYTIRQMDYAHSLHLNGVYTPQIVVNGTKEFIGSEESTLRNAIKFNIDQPINNTLILSDIKLIKHSISINYQAGGNISNSNIIVALIQKSAQSRVKGGENNGRSLSHIQIVRELNIQPLNNKGEGVTSINIPQGLNVMECEIISFLQNTHTGRIIAASKGIIEKL